jgi:F-type H+-transporting ATPase subunit delta
MKVSKDAARAARQLFRLSHENGKLDGSRVRTIFRRVADAKPRGYQGILAAYLRLVRLEVERRHAVIESAEPLGDELGSEVLAGLKRKLGDDLTSEFRTSPDLIGGMRVKVGSDVWDGSVKAKLARLAERL